MRRSIPIGIVVATVLAGCAGTESKPPLQIVIRDSGGVEILEYPAGFEADLPRWEVAAKPLVDIGERDEPGHDLDQVGGAVRLTDGRIVIINRGSNELRVFDSTGSFLHLIGRRGEGPGEFLSLGTLQRLPGDTLLVLDMQLRRTSLFLPSGQFVKSAGVMHVGERSYRTPVGRLGDGRFLGTEYPMMDYQETSGPVRREPYALVMLEANGAIADTLAVVPGFERYPGVASEGGRAFPTVKPVQFGRMSLHATDGNRIYVGTNDADGIRVYSADGTLRRILRNGTPPEPVTEAHRQQRIKENLARIARRGGSEQVKGEWRKNEEDARFAEVFPYYEQFLVGTDGSLWVELARRAEDEGRRYLVYDTAGKAIATVKSVDRVRPFDVGPDLVIGLWRDPDDVQHVRVYRVKR